MKGATQEVEGSPDSDGFAGGRGGDEGAANPQIGWRP